MSAPLADRRGRSTSAFLCALGVVCPRVAAEGAVLAVAAFRTENDNLRLIGQVCPPTAVGLVRELLALDAEKEVRHALTVRPESRGRNCLSG
jgi:hypothetical protein